MNEIKCFTVDETAEAMNASPSLVRDWQKSGALRGIKSGKGMMFTTTEILKFQRWAVGHDISNLANVVALLKECPIE